MISHAWPKVSVYPAILSGKHAVFNGKSTLMQPKNKAGYDNVRKRQGLGKNHVNHLPEFKIAGAA